MRKILILLTTALLLLAGQSPAHAELQHPRQDWLRASTAGLFLHWGMRTSPGYTSCAAWETAVTSGGWNADYWITERIRDERPNFVLSNNNEDTPIMDTISNEQKTGMTPSYDYPQAVYTAAPRLIEACFKLSSSGAWWYSGSNSVVDYKLTLGRLLTNKGADVKALMAETAMVNGKFPSNQEAFNNYANGFLGKIWESIDGTWGGGYDHGGLKPGFWNNGAHGVTTVSKINPSLNYVHVITPPSGSTLSLRDNGYQVARVTNLRTGAVVRHSQRSGTLTLSGVSTWDQYDTVFKVETSGRTGILSGYTMSASASGSGTLPRPRRTAAT